MALVPVPSAEIDDVQVARALLRAVRVINPVVDVLARSDPFGVKDRSRHLGTARGPLGKALEALAWVLDTADVPGTKAWDEKNLDERVDWWVRRVGALDTVLVALPGVFGAVADSFPIQDVLGFSNQAIVLCAVARECGMDDYGQQVRLLGAVLCDRDLGTGTAGAEAAESAPADGLRLPFASSLWHLAGIFRAIGDELVKRPRPRAVYRYLGMLPAVGVIPEYFGEYGALLRAAKAGRAWINHQPPLVRSRPSG